MNFTLPKPLYRIHRSRIIGNLIAYIGYAWTRLYMPLAVRLAGFRQIPLGTSVIWTAKNKKQTILDGIECLRSHDPEMFLRLTTKAKLFIYYSGNYNITNLFGYLFGLREGYIKQGPEGVAYFIVQSLIVSDAHPSINQHRKNDLTYNRLRTVPRKTMEWMQQHSVDPEIINSYVKVVEHWEQRYSNIGTSHTNQRIVGNQ
jgi:hypothetical protein